MPSRSCEPETPSPVTEADLPVQVQAEEMTVPRCVSGCRRQSQ